MLTYNAVITAVIGALRAHGMYMHVDALHFLADVRTQLYGEVHRPLLIGPCSRMPTHRVYGLLPK